MTSKSIQTQEESTSGENLSAKLEPTDDVRQKRLMRFQTNSTQQPAPPSSPSSSLPPPSSSPPLTSPKSPELNSTKQSHSSLLKETENNEVSGNQSGTKLKPSQPIENLTPQTLSKKPKIEDTSSSTVSMTQKIHNCLAKVFKVALV